MRLQYPLAVLDFEASSLELAGFPIEVGVAIVRAAHGPIESWSTLISPDPAWDFAAGWNPASQQVHGIAHGELDGGMSAAAVLKRLDGLLASIGHAWCDGGAYDQHWFLKLCQAAGARPKFHLWDIAGLFALDRRAHNRFAEVLAESEPPHRAGADATRVCEAIVAAGRIA